MGGARVFRKWNAGSGAFQTKSGKVPVVLEMCQLVPDVFGNVRQVSVFSRCFSSWSAGSGRFRKISEGFDVIPLFFQVGQLVPEDFGNNSEGFHVIPLCVRVGLRCSVAKGWFERYVGQRFSDLLRVSPLFFMLANGVQVFSMFPRCVSSCCPKVFGWFPSCPIVFHVGARFSAVSLVRFHCFPSGSTVWG